MCKKKYLFSVKKFNMFVGEVPTLYSATLSFQSAYFQPDTCIYIYGLYTCLAPSREFKCSTQGHDHASNF